MHLVFAGASTPSHVYPSLALVSELVSRRHRITYVIGERLGGLVARTGADVLTHPTVLPDAEHAWPDDVGEASQLFLDDAIAALPRMLAAIERPDAALYDIGGLAGRVAAHHWGVPAVQLSPTYVAWEGYEQDMAEHVAAYKATPSAQHYYATLRNWLAEHDVPLDPDVFLGRPKACVVLIPRALQPNSGRIGPQYIFAGPCIDTTRTQGWSPEPGDARPLVYVSFGTSYTDLPDVYRLCVEELANEHRLVLSTGKVDPAVLGPLPVGVQAARSQPQLDVLAHASVFVTHAGMGSTVESLWFGVPTVAIPQAVDQFANAAQLEAIGAGVRLPIEQIDGQSVRAAVAAAIDRTERAQELRNEVRAQGGVAACADAVERFAGSTAVRRHSMSGREDLDVGP